MTTELEALLERMKPMARDQIVRVLGHSNTCIPTCRVLQAVLGHFKFQSFPVATEVTACNPMYAEMIMSLGGRDAAVEPTPDQLKAWQDKGAWAVAISGRTASAGVPMATQGWDGHLVLRVEDILLDGSIEMCGNATKNLILPKLLWVAVDSDWDKANGLVGVTLENGCEVSYEKLNDTSWQESTYWKSETEPYKSTTRKIVEAIVTRVSL